MIGQAPRSQDAALDSSAAPKTSAVQETASSLRGSYASAPQTFAVISRYLLLLSLAVVGLSCDSSQGVGSQNEDPCYLDTACPLGTPIPSSLLRAAITVTMDDATTAGYSGVLLNTVHGEGTPYVLTARHTRSGRLDDLNEWLGWLEFHVGHRNRICSVDRELPPCSEDACCIKGGTVVATGADRDGWPGTGTRDFRLIRLSRPIPAICDAAYAGWSLDTSNVSGGIAVGYPRGRPLAAVIAEGPMRGVSHPGAEGMLWAPITQGRLELGQSGSPLAQSDGKVLGIVRTGTACPPQPGTGTSVPTLVHNWLHGPPGSRLVDHLAGGDASVRSVPARN